MFVSTKSRIFRLRSLGSVLPSSSAEKPTLNVLSESDGFLSFPRGPTAPALRKRGVRSAGPTRVPRRPIDGIVVRTRFRPLRRGERPRPGSEPKRERVSCYYYYYYCCYHYYRAAFSGFHYANNNNGPLFARVCVLLKIRSSDAPSGAEREARARSARYFNWIYIYVDCLPRRHDYTTVRAGLGSHLPGEESDRINVIRSRTGGGESRIGFDFSRRTHAQNSPPEERLGGALIFPDAPGARPVGLDVFSGRVVTRT